MKNCPSISIALATFNGGAHLQEQLDSLAAQASSPFELVATDDGSEDETIGLIGRFSRNSPFPVRLFRNQKRLGYGRNFLKAASMCVGTHVAFCDQDDVWLPQKIARISAVLQERNFDLVVHSAKVVDRQLNWLGVKYPDIDFSKVESNDGDSNGYFWPGFALTVSKSLLSEVHAASYFAANDFKFAHDELICSLAHERFCCLIDEPLALYRQHGDNLIGFHGAMKARAEASKNS
jgi:glycosyltransferase involved in cell wall biosynthesis